MGEPLARCDLRGHTHTHLEAGDHRPVLPLLIVPDYNVDGATKGPENESNPMNFTINCNGKIAFFKCCEYEF